jgi:hypothetical protein
LPFAHAKGVPQSQNFSNLPHRRSLGGHRTSPLHGCKRGLVRDSIANIEQLVEEGFEAVLSRKQRETPAVSRIFDGES